MRTGRAPTTPPTIAALFDLVWDVGDTGEGLEGEDVEDVGEGVTAKPGLKQENEYLNHL